MNLISCDSCGGVFDLDKLELPTEMDDDGPNNNWTWDSSRDTFVPLFICPICSEGTPATKND